MEIYTRLRFSRSVILLVEHDRLCLSGDPLSCRLYIRSSESTVMVCSLTSANFPMAVF